MIHGFIHGTSRILSKKVAFAIPVISLSKINIIVAFGNGGGSAAVCLHKERKDIFPISVFELDITVLGVVGVVYLNMARGIFFCIYDRFAVFGCSHRFHFVATLTHFG